MPNTLCARLNNVPVLQSESLFVNVGPALEVEQSIHTHCPVTQTVKIRKLVELQPIRRPQFSTGVFMTGVFMVELSA